MSRRFAAITAVITAFTVAAFTAALVTSLQAMWAAATLSIAAGFAVLLADPEDADE